MGEEMPWESAVRVSRVLGQPYEPPVGSESWIRMKIQQFYATPEGKAERARLVEDKLLAAAGYPPKMRAKRRAEALETIRRERVREKGKKQAHVKRLHHERQRLAMPAWVDREALRAVYAEAQRITAETGQPHEVDHIEPLMGKDVSGLHVPWNLRVVHRTVNRRKCNRRE